MIPLPLANASSTSALYLSSSKELSKTSCSDDSVTTYAIEHNKDHWPSSSNLNMFRLEETSPAFQASSRKILLIPPWNFIKIPNKVIENHVRTSSISWNGKTNNTDLHYWKYEKILQFSKPLIPKDWLINICWEKTILIVHPHPRQPQIHPILMMIPPIPKTNRIYPKFKGGGKSKPKRFKKTTRGYGLLKPPKQTPIMCERPTGSYPSNPSNSKTMGKTTNLKIFFKMASNQTTTG
jgi:hypothetical protein